MATPAGGAQDSDFKGLASQTRLTAHIGAQGFFSGLSKRKERPKPGSSKGWKATPIRFLPSTLLRADEVI